MKLKHLISEFLTFTIDDYLHNMLEKEKVIMETHVIYDNILWG